MNALLTKFGRWLLTQATWRSVVRVSGLAGMLYLVVARQHPDATALVAVGTMMGLSSFISLTPSINLPGEKKDDEL